jgi:hypothetical protein
MNEFLDTKRFVGIAKETSEISEYVDNTREIFHTQREKRKRAVGNVAHLPPVRQSKNIAPLRTLLRKAVAKSVANSNSY